MKILSGLSAVALLLAFSSCDKIEGPTRESISVDTTCSFDTDNSVAVKKVLVEDYTGHTCGNCPPAGFLLNETMKNNYGDRLVVITIHAGDYAEPCPGGGPCPPVDTVEFPPSIYPDPFAKDFRTATGNEWNTFFGVFFYPAGMVDRIDYPNSHIKPKDSWDSETAAQLNLPAKVRIRIQNTYDDTERKLRACVETKFQEAVTGDYKLSVVLTEDSVIDWQVWYGHNPELVHDYVHHHLLRTSLNSDYGVSVASDSTEANTTVVNGYSTILDDSWNPDHCAVVAFVYNKDTYELLQVEEVKVK